MILHSYLCGHSQRANLPPPKQNPRKEKRKEGKSFPVFCTSKPDKCYEKRETSPTRGIMGMQPLAKPLQPSSSSPPP